MTFESRLKDTASNIRDIGSWYSSLFINRFVRYSPDVGLPKATAGLALRAVLAPPLLTAGTLVAVHNEVKNGDVPQPETVEQPAAADSGQPTLEAGEQQLQLPPAPQVSWSQLSQGIEESFVHSMAHDLSLSGR